MLRSNEGEKEWDLDAVKNGRDFGMSDGLERSLELELRYPAEYG